MSPNLRRAISALFLLVVVPLHQSLAAGGKEAHYLTPATVDLTRILAPPPAADSAEQRVDLEAVVAAANQRSPAEAANAQADGETSVFRFADAVGPDFTKEKLPFATKFFTDLAGDSHAIVGAAKVKFGRPRPYVTDPQIPALLRGEAGKDAVAHPSGAYPSGHSSFAYTTAVILAAMLPEKATAIFARADVFVHNRLVAGVHYPTDLEAGRISGTVIANALLHDPAFLKDFAQARKEVRHAVGLN